MPCSGNNPGGNAAGAGLYAQYYSGYFADNQGFFASTTPGLTRVDAGVNFTDNASFGVLQPTAGGSAADPSAFSLRQRGSLRIATAGIYTLHLTADDAAYLWLDNAALSNIPDLSEVTIDNGGAHEARTVQTLVYLTAGWHNVLVHYGDDAEDNILVLEYESAAAGISRQVIPSSEFCTAVQPMRNLPTMLRYLPASQTIVAGNATTSGAPAVTSATSVQYVLANASVLPAGITLDAATGQLSASALVPAGTYRADVAVINAEGAVTFSQAYNLTVVPAPPVGCSGSSPDGQPASGGLYAEYYSGYFNDDPTYFSATTPSIRQVQGPLNFSTDADWGNLTPTASGSAANPDLFSARFRGSLFLAAAGTYTFYLTSDDASRLWLGPAAIQASPTNSAALIDNGGRHTVRTVAATVSLAAGLHDLLVHFGEEYFDEVLLLEYSSTDLNLARQVIPAAAFCSAARTTLSVAAAPAKQIRQEISAAPNPSAGSFRVQITQSQPRPGQLQLLDLHGRVCHTQELPGAAQQEVGVAVPGLPAGLYLVRLLTTNGTTTHKVVLQ